jgi:hypothetical protein
MLRPRTVALPKSIPKRYFKEQSPKVFGAGEPNGPPCEDFSRGGEKDIVRHYPYFRARAVDGLVYCAGSKLREPEGFIE